MLQIDFQNKVEDIDAFASYMAYATDEGQQIGKQVHKGTQIRGVTLSIIIGLFIWGIEDSISLAINISLVALAFYELLLMATTSFKPNFYYGRQVYKNQEKNLSSKDIDLITSPKIISIDEEWLEIRSSESMRRCKWSCIDKIGITNDFIFIHAGKCPIVYVPKRDFPSEQSFREFAEAIENYRKQYDYSGIPQSPVG